MTSEYMYVCAVLVGEVANFNGILLVPNKQRTLTSCLVLLSDDM